jgi:phage-related protein
MTQKPDEKKLKDKEKLEKAQYFRLLELMAVISEEWGEAIKELNDYNWKKDKRTVDTLEKAIKEIDQMYSPMFELQGLLETMVKLKKNG